MLPKDFRPAELHEQRFHVDFDYPVVFCHDVLAEGDSTLAWALARKEPERRHPVFVVLDQGLVGARATLPSEVERYVHAHSASLELRAAPRVMLGGEAVKNDPGLVRSLLEDFVEAKLDRQAAVVIVGG